MIQYSEIKAARVLNPTSIDLGEYVINPYKGCVFSCLYCYVRSNKSSSRSSYPWGCYVQARINIGEQLEKELLLKKPKCVLLGSTTECFQPVEEKYGLTKRVLEILNKHEVNYVILTRSPLIREYVSLLGAGFCKSVYFTVNDFSPELKTALEPASPAFQVRYQAIDELLKHNISVITYVCPVLPGITDIAALFKTFSGTKLIDFEGLNFSLKNIKEIVEAIGLIHPHLQEKYRKMLVDSVFYETIWLDFQSDIMSQARKAGKDCHVFIHPFGGYFNNRYVNSS